MARSSLKNICRLINEANESLPVEQSFLADLKRSIEMCAKADSRKPSKYYKPSSLNCIRNMYYQRVEEEPDENEMSYCSVGITNSGTDTHVRIQNYVERMKDFGIDCEYMDVGEYVKSRGLDYLDIISKNGMETKLFHKDLQMSFLCDGIIRYKNHYYVLEIKTEMGMKWSSRTGVDASHYNQGTAYSIAFNLPEVLFVYINRDMLDMKAYMFVPTDEMKAELIGKIDNCEGYVKRMICPPKPEDVAKKTCNYCGYKNKCGRDR